ncbi:MAG: LysE family transporter [Thermodesulfobacteriota bacterium]
MDLSAFFTVMSLSFVVALTGAMAPGPLLTYTIVQSARTRKRGYLVGVWVIVGHALIEAAIILLLLAGFSMVLQKDIAAKIIGLTGGALLVMFSLMIIRDLYREKIPDEFTGEPPEPEAVENRALIKKALRHPVTGGALVSMSNPYWWIWWATIGFAFMMQFNVSFDNLSGFFAFFIGHEAGDLAWYALVSVLSYWGIRRLNRKVYYATLGCCAVFMAGFGVYLGISPFLAAG